MQQMLYPFYAVIIAFMYEKKVEKNDRGRDGNGRLCGCVRAAQKLGASVDKQNPPRYNMPCQFAVVLRARWTGKCGSSSVVEHHLAKVGVAGPSPVFRSMTITRMRKCAVFILLGVLHAHGPIAQLVRAAGS